QWPGLLRGLLVVAGLVAAGAVVAFTAKGMQAREFLSESMFELRKVVWPTRQETIRTTGMVLVVVVIVALVLSGFDLVISWLIRLLLGQ
ncbi:MAG TPA: preprotein translocase subunit SecE, partial [Arenimonas sp.]|nr:preprotein translocase subunit SecE [Arenimonas sp.]